uniref:Endoplasmic reticulum vesicle transporter N-terminal domain-containing protein n=1 Tax=Hyaloperonospora arabidopsidis (strain Emoy2) TaxID=559515 RepID=M4BPL4_HYAAE
MRQRAVKNDVADGGRSATDAHESLVSRSARRVLKTVDVYPKMHREFNVQTEFGATVSIVAALVMLVLFLSELHAYWRPNTHEHMVVDTSLSAKLQVNLDISYLAINCRDAHINAMDVAGELQVNMHQTIVKTRLDDEGNAIGRPVAMERRGESTVSDEGEKKTEMVYANVVFSAMGRAAQNGGVFQYYIKIVPTIYSDIDEKAIHSYQQMMKRCRAKMIIANPKL